MTKSNKMYSKFKLIIGRGMHVHVVYKMANANKTRVEFIASQLSGLTIPTGLTNNKKLMNHVFKRRTDDRFKTQFFVPEFVHLD